MTMPFTKAPEDMTQTWLSPLSATDERRPRPSARLVLALLVVANTACVTFPRASVPPSQPGADAEWIAARDGQRLFSTWQRPAEVRGVVWYVVGPECGSAALYPQLTRALLSQGYVVTTFHPRGSGFSPGERGDVDADAFLDDFRAFHDEISRQYPSLPLVLLGHSAGAAFALELGARTKPDAVILVNAAYRLRATEGMTPTFGQYLTYAANLIFRPRVLTVDMNSDPSAIAFGPDRDEGLALQRDPLVVRYFSMRMLLAQQRVMERCAENVARLEAPVLIIEGAHDALVDPAGNDELVARAKAKGSKKHVASDGGHGSSAVETSVEAIVDWLRQH
ncbi:MAG: alpha/beta fold hydrolase [Myxococcales bacterium]|nr:alpha/beta fold hydrolase [Myxococcales bacterium]